MNPGPPRHLVALGALLLGCGGPDPEPAATAQRGDVVLIVIDTLRRDHLSCYGNPRRTSPNLDALAAEGVRFDRCFSQAPWTTPSIGSMLSSQYPSTLGIENEQSALADSVVLLPEVMQEAGYRTGAVVSHSFCSSYWNFDQGFDSFDESNVRGHEAVTSRQVTDRALEFLQRAGDAPVFLWAHYFDPHHSYIEHEGFTFPRAEPYDGPVRSGMRFAALRRAEPLSEADIVELRRLYDSEIAFTDHHIGRLLEALRARPQWPRSAVFVVGDHGEEFFEHGALGHTRSLYSELTNVPFLARWPGQPAGPSDLLVAPLDIYPTILDLLGLPAPEGLAGRSLLQPQEGERLVVSETSRRRRLQAAIRGEYKLIRNPRRTVGLYHLGEDAGEQVDLQEEHPALVKELSGALDRWQEEVRRDAVAAPSVDIDADRAEQLRQLGYLEEEDEESGDSSSR